MRSISILLLSTLLACGPLAPPLDAGSSTDDTTTSPTTPPPNPTAASTSTTAVDPTTDAPSDPTTTAGSSTSHFIITPDASDHGTIQCDLYKQDCDRGEKCVAWADDASSWNATRCVEVTGDRLPGEPCTSPGGGLTGIDDCTFGAYCWYVDKNDHGTCVAQCTGTPNDPNCPIGFACSVCADCVLALCFPGCDPLLQDCPGDDLCIPSGDIFQCVLDASGEAGELNDPCEFANSCDRGLACIDTKTASAACDPDATGCCQPFCQLPNSPCPNPDQQCVPWYDLMQPVPPGYEDVGICKFPN